MGRIALVASSTCTAFVKGYYVDSVVVVASVGKLVTDRVIVVELTVGMAHV